MEHTSTTTKVYAQAPCGHRVEVPNEAHERPVEVACTEGDVLHVLEVDGIASCDFVGAPGKPMTVGP